MIPIDHSLYMLSDVYEYVGICTCVSVSCLFSFGKQCFSTAEKQSTLEPVTLKTFSIRLKQM